jgi:DNA (cytosine-5)-methyltransferase 1
MVALSTKHFSRNRFEFPNIEVAEKKDISKYIDFNANIDKDYYLDKNNRYYELITKAVKDKSCIYQLRKYQVRAKEKGVCPTLTANMGTGGHNVPFIMNGVGLRKLTEFECLKLQGFPKTFSFPDDVPKGQRYKQVGNAVCVPVAELVAKKVQELF